VSLRLRLFVPVAGVKKTDINMALGKRPINYSRAVDIKGRKGGEGGGGGGGYKRETGQASEGEEDKRKRGRSCSVCMRRAWNKEKIYNKKQKKRSALFFLLVQNTRAGGSIHAHIKRCWRRCTHTHAV